MIFLKFLQTICPIHIPCLRYGLTRVPNNITHALLLLLVDR